jgi:hypothetical protein
MNHTAVELKKELHKSLDLLRTLRDEVRVNLHLAGMDAKAEWAKLEPHLADVEKRAGQLGDAARTAVDDAVKRLSSFRASLKK